MKLSEIARYWAAKELTTISVEKNKILLKAPFAAPGFTLKVNSSIRQPVINIPGGETKSFSRVNNIRSLQANTWYSEKSVSIICLDLVKRTTEIII
jgi:hypothetical protein